MQIKHAVAAFGLVAATVAALVVTSPKAQEATSTLEAASVISDFGCTLRDGNGDFVTTDASHAVITSSGNTNFKCSVTGVPNSTGQAVITSGFLCNTQGGLTDDTREVVSASGNATMTCKVH